MATSMQRQAQCNRPQTKTTAAMQRNGAGSASRRLSGAGRDSGAKRKQQRQRQVNSNNFSSNSSHSSAASLSSMVSEDDDDDEDDDADEDDEDENEVDGEEDDDDDDDDDEVDYEVDDDMDDDMDDDLDEDLDDDRLVLAGFGGQRAGRFNNKAISNKTNSKNSISNASTGMRRNNSIQQQSNTLIGTSNLVTNGTELQFAHSVTPISTLHQPPQTTSTTSFVRPEQSGMDLVRVGASSNNNNNNQQQQV